MMNDIDQLICQTFKIAATELRDDMGMKDIAGWDSLSHMNLIAAFETRYPVELSGDEIADMQTIADIRRILSRHTAGHCA